MKINYLAILLSFLIITSCKKDEKKPDSNSNIGTVEIEQKTYKTVTIDNQEWTTENYNGDKGIYPDNVNTEVYGKLLTLKQTRQIILPSGWRIPTVEDYVKLINKYGGFVSYNSNGAIDRNIIDKDINIQTLKKLSSNNYWTIKGNNESGFNAVPGGYKNGGKGSFCALWTSTIYQAQSNIYQPMLLGIFTDQGEYEGFFAELADPISSLTEDSRGSGSIRFVRNK